MSIKRIFTLNENLNNEQIEIICSELSNFNNKSIENLRLNLNVELAKEIENNLKINNHLKKKEFYYYFKNNQTIKLNFIEDWKDDKKINLIKLLIVFNYVEYRDLIKLIGNQSKKTYLNGEKINESSLSLNKFFNDNLKNDIDIFYSTLDLIREKIVNIGVDKDLVKNVTKEMISLIECEVVCRVKYENNEFIKYKQKIEDIIETRNKEKILFELFNKIRFVELIHDPQHEAFKFLILNYFNETRNTYPWLTELITYINNYSKTSKEFLIKEYQLDDFNGKDEETLKTLIENVSSKVGLNMEKKDEIIQFIFAMGIFYKHGTYHKWYLKELKHLNSFENFKNNSFDENLLILINKLNIDNNHENAIELFNLMKNYLIKLNTI